MAQRRRSPGLARSNIGRQVGLRPRRPACEVTSWPAGVQASKSPSCLWANPVLLAGCPIVVGAGALEASLDQAACHGRQRSPSNVS